MIARDDQPEPRTWARRLCLAWEPLRLPPPWWLPGPDPACGAVLDVPARATNDGVARRFVCDLPAGHLDGGDPLPGDDVGEGRHRAVIDPDEGRSFVWSTRPAGRLLLATEGADDDEGEVPQW